MVYLSKGDDFVEQKEQCFIITPIGDENSEIRRHIEGIIDAVIKPALEDQYKIEVAHRISTPGSITKQIIEAIYNSKLVIANLTNCNPNVMYELALRHGIGKPVIMIAEDGTRLPSDVMMQRTIFYRNDAMGVLKLREDLRDTASKIDFEKASGLVFEALGEISHDAAMLKNVAEKDSDSKEPLEYIMRRLDRIESSINVREPVSSNPIANMRVIIDCEAVDEKKDSLRIQSSLSKLLLNAGCEMTAFGIDDNKIYLGVHGPMNYARRELHTDIFNVLEELNIHAFSCESRPN